MNMQLGLKLFMLLGVALLGFSFFLMVRMVASYVKTLKAQEMAYRKRRRDQEG